MGIIYNTYTPAVPQSAVVRHEYSSIPSEQKRRRPESRYGDELRTGTRVRKAGFQASTELFCSPERQELILAFPSNFVGFVTFLGEGEDQLGGTRNHCVSRSYFVRNPVGNATFVHPRTRQGDNAGIDSLKSQTNEGVVHSNRVKCTGVHQQTINELNKAVSQEPFLLFHIKKWLIYTEAASSGAPTVSPSWYSR